MSYVEKTLGPDEELLMRAHFPALYHFISIVIFLTLGFIIVGIIWAGVRFMCAATTEIAVTNQRFVLKRGLFRRSTDELGLGKIEEIRLTQSVFQRFFGIGSLIVNGTGDSHIETPPIGRPLKFRRAIEQAMEEHEHRLDAVIANRNMHPGLRVVAGRTAPHHP